MNPIANGHITWDHESSCTLDLDEELEHWQNRLHEVSMLHYNMMTKSLRCVSLEVRSFPYYDSLTDVENFLDAFEREVLEKHFFQTLDLVMRGTPTRWWGMHKDKFNGLCEYLRIMKLRFGHPKV